MPEELHSFNRPMSDNQSPFNALPPVIVIICLIMAGLELAFFAGSQGLLGGAQGITWRTNTASQYGFSPVVLDYMMIRGDFGFDVIRRFVTYPFVHWSFQDALFGTAMTLALGKFVGDAFGNIATLILWIVTAVAGALAFGLILSGPVPLVGAFPPAYGLIGAYTYLIWLRLGQAGEKQLAAFRLIGFLMALQLVFGLLFGPSPTWIAEIAGFVVGFGIAPLLAPGGFQALLVRLRQR